jgi:hypothetical protein
MARTSGVSKTCARVLKTCMPSCTDWPARLFFMLEAHDPHGTVGHVAASEPISAGRQGPEPVDTWQRQSPPRSGGEVQSQRTCDSAGAHLSREARSRTAEHMAAPEPTLAGRRGSSRGTRGSA